MLRMSLIKDPRDILTEFVRTNPMYDVMAIFANVGTSASGVKSGRSIKFFLGTLNDFLNPMGLNSTSSLS